jgi:hypothetical protein
MRGAAQAGAKAGAAAALLARARSKSVVKAHIWSSIAAVAFDRANSLLYAR